ncbi:MAG: RNA polymerase factor sigma-54 [Acidobacteriota bacterium]
MALEQKLSLRLAQKLVMTPSLQQAIKLLQMTRLELEGVLTQELVENPILEEGEMSLDDAAAEANAEEAAETEKDDALSDVDLEAFFGDYAESWEGSGNASVFEERQGPPLENTLSREDDLYDHLLWQLHMMSVPPLLREVAELIIGNLDPDGFLVATIEEIQAMGADGYAADSLLPIDVIETEGQPSEPTEGAGEDEQTSDEIRVATAETGQAALRVELEHPSTHPGLDGIVGTTPDRGALDARQDAARPSDELPWPSTEAWSSALSQQHSSQQHSSQQHSSQPLSDPGEALAAADAAAAQDASAATQDSARGLEAEPFRESADPDAEQESADFEPEIPGYPRELVEKALELVRNLEPPGVACADLRESLLSQLDASGEPEDSMARYLVAEKWQEFTRRKFEAIAKSLEVPLKSLKPAVEKISQLNTRPGRQFSTDRTHYVEPDVYIVKVGDKYVVQLNDNGLPRLRVSGAYRKMLQAMRQQKSEADAQQYIKDKMRSALWLIKSLDQRQRTIYKVAASIVQQQRAFLDHGVEHLRPMVLRDVAEDIEMHESTVSRVVSNKYMHTPRGLLPMKFFFHSGIDRDYGGDISSLTVKRKIQHFIQGEDAKKPLSDSELMRILNREGIHIARRTVAKYRDELGIPSSTERKQIF